MGKTGTLDFHCHLDDPCFDKNRWQLIDQCFSSGFAKLVTVADPFHPQSIEKTGEMLAYHHDIHAVIGAHPHQADSYTPEIEQENGGISIKNSLFLPSVRLGIGLSL